MTQPPGTPGPYGPPGPPRPNGPYAPQGAPPPYPQAPAPYPQAPAPYPQSQSQSPTPYASAPNPYAPGPAIQTPPPRRRNLVLIGVAIVLGLALVLTAAYAIGRVTAPTITQPSMTPVESTSPTPTPTPSSVRPGFTLEGNVLSGPTFTARLPAGWVLSDTNGGTNDGEIVKGRAVITYSGPVAGTAEKRCTDLIESFRAKYGGTVETLSGHWGRRETVTKHLVAPGTENREVSMLATCVDRPGNLAALLVSATDTDHVQVATDLVSLLNSWEWV